MPHATEVWEVRVASRAVVWKRGTIVVWFSYNLSMLNETVFVGSGNCSINLGPWEASTAGNHLPTIFN